MSIPLHQKIQNAIKPEMKEVLVELDLAIDLFWIAVFSGHKLGMFGRPGNAKTLLNNTGVRHVTGTNKFYTNGHSHMKAEELIGPIDIQKMHQGIFDRNGKGFLQDPNVGMSMFDEVGRIKSLKSILLPYLNEGRITIGNTVIDCTNLITSVLASNSEFTETDDEAINDRIGLRVIINEFKTETATLNFLNTFHSRRKKRNGNPNVTTISHAEIKQAQEDIVNNTTHSKETIEMVVKIKMTLSDIHNIYISNRMLDWFMHVLLVVAWLDGRKETNIYDCEIGKHMFWKHSDQIPVVHKTINQLVNAELDTMQAKYDEVLKIQLTPNPDTAELKGINQKLDEIIKEWEVMNYNPKNRVEYMRLLSGIKSKKESINRKFSELAGIR